MMISEYKRTSDALKLAGLGIQEKISDIVYSIAQNMVDLKQDQELIIEFSKNCIKRYHLKPSLKSRIDALIVI